MSKMGDSRFRELKARKGAKWKEKNRELWNGENISHEDTKARRENRVSVFMRLPRIQTLTQCIIFISFMSFMVSMAVLCGFVTLCEKRSRNDGMVLHRYVQDVQNGVARFAGVESREQGKHV